MPEFKAEVEGQIVRLIDVERNRASQLAQNTPLLVLDAGQALELGHVLIAAAELGLPWGFIDDLEVGVTEDADGIS